MLYVNARIADEAEELIYRRYITDALKITAENISRVCGGNYLNVSFIDLISEAKPKETKSGQEIAAEVIKRARLVVTPE